MKKSQENSKNPEQNKISEMRQRYNVSKAIVEAIKNDEKKKWINDVLTLQTVEDVSSRVYPTQTEKLYDTISEMDAYYIPEDLNLSDEDLYKILNWLLCRPQYFGRNLNNPKERIITNDWSLC